MKFIQFRKLARLLLLISLSPVTSAAILHPLPQNVTTPTVAVSAKNGLTPFPPHTQGDFIITGSVDTDTNMGGYFSEYAFSAFHNCLARKPRGLRVRTAGHIAYVSNRYQVRAEGTWLQGSGAGGVYGDLWDAVEALYKWGYEGGSLIEWHPVDVVISKRDGEGGEAGDEIARVVLTLEHGEALPLGPAEGGRLILDGTVYPERKLPGGEKVVQQIFGQELKRFGKPGTVGQHFDYRWEKDGVEMFIYFELKPYEQREKHAYSHAEVQALLDVILNWYVEGKAWSETCGNFQDKTLENEDVGRWHLGIKSYDLPASDGAVGTEQLDVA